MIFANNLVSGVGSSHPGVCCPTASFVGEAVQASVPQAL